MTKTALVTGATGVVGPTLIKLLIDQGWNVRAVARRLPPQASFRQGQECVAADVSDPEAMKRVTRGVEAVFHLAATLHERAPIAVPRERYAAVNVDGARNVARAARDAGVETIVHASTINVLGPTRRGETWDDETPPRPPDPYSRSKLEGELAVREARPDSVVIRLGAVYGGRMKGNYLRMLDYIRKGRFVHVGRADNRRSLVFEDDAAAALAAAAHNKETRGRTYIVTDGEPHTMKEIADAMANALGRPRPTLHVPAAAAGIAFASVGAWRRLKGDAVGWNRETLAKITEDMSVVGHAARRDFGYVPKWPLGEGWRETLKRLSIEGGKAPVPERRM
ncbi:MAG: NAD-dependent epimerase/dehydratase family protein [Euryarchaeota archaeon]|nr:NAD-dependent epimerase/dehydratase family protein [Euryarchaeota archaeon]